MPPVRAGVLGHLVLLPLRRAQRLQEIANETFRRHQNIDQIDG